VSRETSQLQGQFCPFSRGEKLGGGRVEKPSDACQIYMATMLMCNASAEVIRSFASQLGSRIISAQSWAGLRRDAGIYSQRWEGSERCGKHLAELFPAQVG